MGRERILQAFGGHEKTFVAFLTGGDPTIDDTRRYIRRLVACGVGLIEIGVPFSDPIAEGPVIQESSRRALASGTTLSALLSLVHTLREEDGLTVPIVMMTYLNPIHHYGYSAFFARAHEVGLDGIIVPDLPYEEHDEIREFTGQADVPLISMIAPTSTDRAQMIARDAEGFIYLVSSMGVTGVRTTITTDIASIVSEIRQVSQIPVAVGFGISTPQQAASMASVADGVIVGSAIVQIIARHGTHADQAIEDYVRPMVEATKGH